MYKGNGRELKHKIPRFGVELFLSQVCPLVGNSQEQNEEHGRFCDADMAGDVKRRTFTEEQGRLGEGWAMMTLFGFPVWLRTIVKRTYPLKK